MTQSHRHGYPFVQEKFAIVDRTAGCVLERFCLALDRWIWRMHIQRRLRWRTAGAVRLLPHARWQTRAFKQGYHFGAATSFPRHGEDAVRTIIFISVSLCVCSLHLTYLWLDLISHLRQNKLCFLECLHSTCLCMCADRMNDEHLICSIDMCSDVSI